MRALGAIDDEGASGQPLASIRLPMPPSANRMWRVFRGRPTLSSEYRAWKEAAATSIAAQWPHPPLRHYSMTATIPASRRDLDNACKPLGDALQAGGAVENDRYLRALSLAVDDAATEVTIRLAPADPPPPKRRTRRG